MTALPVVGELIAGKYQIVRHIGDGGMGAVFEAKHKTLGNSVALKFLLPEVVELQSLAERFLREAQLCATIQSPHVTRVSDIDNDAEHGPYIVMDLLRGESLSQMIKRSGAIDRDQAVNIALQVLAGLESAHARNVVHRDLKPDNVFVTPSPGGPLVKILDFGIAKLKSAQEYRRVLTQPGAVLGTPEYMAPEQAYGAETVDPRSDLYAVGVILYEMLCGQRPIEGNNVHNVASRAVKGEYQPLGERDPSLPQGLVQVVHRALQGDPDRRYASALEMRRALIPFAGHLSPAAQLAANPSPIGVAPDRLSVTTQPIDQMAQPVQTAAQAPVPTSIDVEVAVSPAPGRVPTPTAEMAMVPAVANMAGSPGARGTPAPTQAAPIVELPKPPPTERTKKHKGLGLVLLALLLLGGGGGAAYWYFAVYQTELPPPPPEPRAKAAQEPASPTTTKDDDWNDDDDMADNQRSTPRTSTPSTPASPRPPATPASTATSGTSPGTLPPLSLPSALPPLPSNLPPIPSALPSLEDLGLKPPGSGTAGSSSGPPAE